MGFTGADLKCAIEDGKLLFAYAKSNGPVEQYFLEAIATIRENRRKYGKRKPIPGSGDGIGFKVN